MSESRVARPLENSDAWLDGRFPKYPRQPVIHCPGFAEKQAAGEQVPTTS